MADPSNSVDCSESTIELNIKTLESQIHKFQVDTKLTVLAFKEKIAQEIGVPVVQQRLIFRGRVLKDEHCLSEYQVENGHTLHLVSRQSTQSQSSMDASSRDASANNSNQSHDAGSGAGNARMGQISHSVLLGTFNVADQGEGMVPDATRVIGAVLNSLGLGGLASGGFGPMPTSNMYRATPNTQASQGNETGGSHNNVGDTGPTGNQTQSGIAPSGQSVQPPPQSVQIPLNAAAPLPSFLAPAPDSLRTLQDFMTCMERALAQNGYQPNTSTNAEGIPRAVLPSNSLGLPTVEALGIVLRHAERLLSGHATAALSHIAGRLEREGATSDPIIRGQIQSESVQIGLAMQHLGALLLELGRTILTLRMGQSHVQSSVNAGPAVYISPSGPNPIMVQPFPLQTNSLFGGSAPPNPTNFGPVGVGNAPRHINIHIHAGTALAPVVSTIGTRAGNVETPSAGRSNGTNLGSGPARVIPLGNFMTAPIPLHSTAGVINTPQSVSSSSVSQNPLLSTRSIVADLNSQIRNLVRDRQVVTQPVEGSVASSTEGDSNSLNCAVVTEAQESNEHLREALFQKDEKAQNELKPSSSNGAQECLSSSKDKSSEDTSFIAEKTGEDPPSSSAPSDIPDGPIAAPLGLGLGNLELKKRVRQPKPFGSSNSSGDGAGNQNVDSLSGGQQILRSLAARGSNDLGANSTVSGPVPTRPMEQLGSDNQFSASAMSEVLQSPALDGLLAGVSEQTGMGSPNILRNMLQQLSQNPQIMSTVGQIAQQVDSQNLENMFSGLGGGQGGGFDLSRMVQSMMPVVSQVLGSGSVSPLTFPTLGAVNQIQSNETSLGCPENLFEGIQIDLREVSESIEHMDAPADVFGAVVRSALRLNDSGSSPEEIVQELNNDEDLVRDYMELLRHDIQQRAQHNSQPDKC